MSGLIINVAFGIFSLLTIFYIVIRIFANTSITQRAIRTEIVINSSSLSVWKVLIDFEAYPQWNPFIRQVKGVASPGKRLKIRILAGSHTMTIKPTVLTVQPEKELRWLGHLFIHGIFDGEHRFSIKPLDENQVLVVQQEEFNGLLVPFSGSLLKETERSFDAMNQALKMRVEKTGRP